MHDSHPYAHFPPAKFPILPVLSAHSLTWPNHSVDSVLNIPQRIELTCGTAAIAKALKLLNVNQQNSVLIPAYHCSSMVEPVLAVGATPVFYKIKPDLSYDEKDIEAKMSATTRVILSTHYFGFPQDMKSLQALCKPYKIAIIEDCAHAFFGSASDRSFGTFSDYTISSVRKFFPVRDGGYLASQHHDLSDAHRDPAGLRYNLTSVLDIIEESVYSKRFRAINALLKIPFMLKNNLRNIYKRNQHQAKVENNTEQTSQAREANDFQYLDIQHIDQAMAISSAIVVKFSNHQTIADKRRKNFNYLLQMLNKVSGARPLYAQLPDGVIPYKFPLLLTSPDNEAVFQALKYQAIPIYRWEDCHPSDCPVSRQYAKDVLQLPCHQEMRNSELTWMAETLIQVLATQNTLKK